MNDNLSTRRRLIRPAVACLAVLAVAALIWATTASASSPLRSLFAPAASPPTLVSYQGFVKVNSSPYTGTGYFKFAVMDAASGNGTINYWANDGAASGEPAAAVALPVTGGLFDVLLGDTSLGGMTQAITQNVFNSTTTYLRVWFSQTSGGPFQALDPNQRIGSAAYALRAERALTADIAVGVGSNASTCTSALTGNLRWTGSAYEICDGVEWRSVTLGPKTSQSQIIMYHAGTPHTGVLGGRGGADAMCADSTDRPAGYKNARAFITVSPNDEIADMPANYGVPIGLPIVSKTGAGVAANWSQLLSGAIIQPLQNAGVLPPSGSAYWWSGSYPNGALYSPSYTCFDWGHWNGYSGLVGMKTTNGNAWIYGPGIACDTPVWVLCLAY